MGYEATAIVSAHIFLNKIGLKDVEILSCVDDDNGSSKIFDDIENFLLDGMEIELNETVDYYFMAIVKAEVVVENWYEGPEYDVEVDVTEIKSISDLINV